MLITHAALKNDSGQTNIQPVIDTRTNCNKNQYGMLCKCMSTQRSTVDGNNQATLLLGRLTWRPYAKCITITMYVGAPCKAPHHLGLQGALKCCSIISTNRSVSRRGPMKVNEHRHEEPWIAIGGPTCICDWKRISIYVALHGDGRNCHKHRYRVQPISKPFYKRMLLICY